MASNPGDSTMVLLASDGSVEPQWTDFIQKADDLGYLSGFKSQGTTHTCSSTHFFSSAYSSEKNAVDFQDPDQDGTGILKDANGGILMGLDPEHSTTAVGNHSFDDVQHAFGVPDGIDGTFGAVINTLKGIGTVAIDTERLGNGSWILPTDSTTLKIVTRLCYKITGAQFIAVKSILSALHDTFGVSVPNTDITYTPEEFAIIFMTTTTLKKDAGSSGVSADSAYTATVKLPNIEGFIFYISHSLDKTIVSLTQGPGDPSKQLQNLQSFSGSVPSSDNALPSWENQFEVLRIWYADVHVLNGSTTWDVALIISLTINGAKLFLRLAYGTDSKKFSGGILLSGSLPVDSQKSLPTYLESHDLPSDILLQVKQAKPFVDLEALTGVTFPKGVPNQLRKGLVDYYQTVPPANTPKFKVTAEIGTGTGTTAPPSGVPAPFDWKNTTFTFTKEPNSLEINSSFDLNPQPADVGKYPSGTLDIDLKHDSGGWDFTGKAKTVNFGVLAEFFDSSFKGALLSVLGKITIQELEVDYAYDSSNLASSFLFTGKIDFGKLELRMYYQYASDSQAIQKLLGKRSGTIPPPPAAVAVPDGKSAWEFEASLSASAPGAKLHDILDSIADGVSASLPSFIGDIDVYTTDTGPSLITIKVATAEVEGQQKVVFVFQITISLLEFSFIQIAGENDASPKRILRLSVGPLPFIQNIPVVKELPQPYEELMYCWVGSDAGLTTGEIDLLNKDYIPKSKIYYKGETHDQSIALRPGHHFIVVNDDTCILDHVFSTGQPSPTALTRHQRKRVVVSEREAQVSQTEPENPPTKGALKKQTQFLTISSISLQYKQETLWLFLDASLVLGPIELDLIGFGIGIVLSKVKLNDLRSLDLAHDLVWQLHGMAMDFDQPPVLIAGVFEHEVTDTLDAYRGGIAVALEPYDFVAVGEYAEVKEGADEYKSIFIYAKLDGPLVDLEIAIIKGVRLGFGYNSFVRSPAVQELANFPLINDVGIGGAGNNPMKILQAMRGGDNPWVQVKHDSYWFAIGFSVSAFDIITATAVALLEFTNQGVVANIFADVIAQMPPEVKSKEECILYVELLLNAELNFIYDFFFVQAALAPTSFLLVPQCHLMGGFALGSWFGRSDYAGDWVFSVGGYHKQFPVPDHYPKPDRLGIKFNIGDDMTIGGEGYFAITPKAVMGGALIYVQLHVGPVSAHLDVGFDALLQFHPLHYIVDVYVDVGVSCHVHVLFVSGDISVDIGARLHIEGPNFGGKAHVDFWFFGFDVYFGEQPAVPPPLHLSAFYDVVAKAGPPEDNTPPGDKVEQDLVVQLKFALENGAFPKAPKNSDPTAPPESAGAGSKWRVRGGDLRFRVSSVFAISSASLATKENVQQKVPGAIHVDPILSNPMQIRQPIQSPLHITIKDREDGSIPDGWRPEFVVKKVPTALWGNPDHPPSATALDPSKPGTVDLPMAVSIAAPKPVLSISKIGPLNATELARELAGEKALDKSETQPEFLPATLDKSPKGWPATQKSWETASKDNAAVAKGMVNACMTSLGWDKPAPEVQLTTQNLTSKPWDLLANLPTRLVTGTGGVVDGVEDGLPNTYMALPRVIAV